MSVQAGDTIARRFTLVDVEYTDLPGVTRYVATDQRLGSDVTVDVITSVAPTSVVKAAQSARVVRDRRLAKVLASGFEGQADNRVAYVVRERPAGLSLADVLGHFSVPLAEASALFGEVAAALAVASAAGEHHGLLRPASLTLTPRGKLLIKGLAVDGELAGQGGIGKGRTERADALALAGLFLSAITGLQVGEVSRADIPGGLPSPVRKLCEAAVKGSGPKTLAEITTALGAGSPRVLKRLALEAPELWWPVVVEPVVVDEPEPVVLAEPEPEPVVTETAVTVPDLEIIDAVIVEPEAGTDLINAEIIDADVIEVAPRPRRRFGGAVDDIDEFHDIVAAQAVDQAHQPAFAELVLEVLAERFPRSPWLAQAAEAARVRAAQAPPINAAPLVVVLLITAVFVAGVIAASRITAPADLPYDGGQQEYPTYSFGVSSPASPTP